MSDGPMRKRIVVAVFGNTEAARDAVAFGVQLARARHAQLILGARWVTLLGRGGLAYDRLVREEIQRDVDELRKDVPSGVAVRASVDSAASILRGLHSLVRDDGDDVLVFSAADLKHRGHGSLALETLHDAPCSVAVAPAGHALAAPAPDVAVAWTDAPEAEAALEAGIEIATFTDGTLRLVHVLTVPTRLADEPWLDANDTRHWLVSTRPEGEASLQRGVELVAHRVPVSTDLRDGLADQELAQAAGGCGLIVAGSRGYGSLRRLVLGSTSAGLLREATVPVLVTPRCVAERRAAVREAVAAWKD
jgi:nucleotide-binding universal stress UspA family protein